MASKVVLFMGLILSRVDHLNGRSDALKAFNGKHLKIGYYDMFGFIHKNPKGARVGFLVDIFQVLGESLNFTYSFIEVDHENIGWIVMKEFLIRKEVDVIGNPLVATTETVALVDFTYIMAIEQTVLIQKLPGLESRLFAIVKPFQLLVWLALGIASVVTVMALFLFTLATEEQSTETKMQIFVTNFDYVFNMLIGQGGGFHSSRFVLRLVAAVWCLMAVILTYSFNGHLVSFLSVPKYEPVMHTFQDLASNPSKSIIMDKGPLLNRIMNSTSGHFGQLRETLEANPNFILTTYEQMMRLLLSGCCSFAVGKTGASTMIQRTFNSSSGECALTMGDEMRNFQIFRTFFLQKDSPYTEGMSQRILQLWENGLLTHMKEPYLSKNVIRHCTRRQIDRPSLTPLSLYDLSSAFIILAIGAPLSILVFALEVGLQKRRFRVEE